MGDLEPQVYRNRYTRHPEVGGRPPLAGTDIVNFVAHGGDSGAFLSRLGSVRLTVPALAFPMLPAPGGRALGGNRDIARGRARWGAE